MSNDIATQPGATRLTSDAAWAALDKASSGVLAYVTPAGEPRAACVVYKVVDGRIYVAVAPDSWKARHIAVNGHVAFTALVPRGGLLRLLFPIPPASISLHGTAVVHPPDDPTMRPLLDVLKPLLPPERAASSALLEITPVGEFVNYGIGVPLTKMRDPAIARSRATT